MQEKTYINGVFIKKVTFRNGGDAINLSINVEKFIEEIRNTQMTKDIATYLFRTEKNRIRTAIICMRY